MFLLFFYFIILLVSFSYRLIAYERLNNGSASNEMRVIISSQNLYFFETSPPDLFLSLDSLIKLEQLAECRATTAKTSKTKV